MGLLGLGITCIVSGSRIDQGCFMSFGQIDSMRKTYIRKILDPASLIRFMMGKTDYRILIKSLVAPLKNILAKKRKKVMPNFSESELYHLS